MSDARSTHEASMEVIRKARDAYESAKAAYAKALAEYIPEPYENAKQD